MKTGLIIVTILVLSIGIPNAFSQPTVEVILEKPTYNYGEKLFYTIKVSEITGDNAIINISDEFGKGSSAIPVPISQLETPVPSQYPFEKEIFPEGKYFIEVSYSGASDKVEFSLVDSGKIVIPFWIKQVAYYWINPDGISDENFTDAIEFLIKEGIITVSQTEKQNESESSSIPNWIKTTTLWWLEEKISDKEYARSLQYLIKEGIITV